QHDHARHHRVDTLERLVVAKASLEIDGASSFAACGAFRYHLLRILHREARDVALRSLAAKWHAAIDPHADLGHAVALKVAAEVGRDLDGNLDVTAAEAAIEFPAGADGRRIAKIPRDRSERLDQISAFRRPILIERTETQILNIEGNTVAESEHENEWPDEGKR